MRDRDRQQGHEDGAEDGTVQAAETTHDHHQQELDREQDAEDIGGEKPDLVGEEGPGGAHESGRVREGHGLVHGETDTHRLGSDFAVPDGHPGAPRRRAQEIRGEPQTPDEKGQAQEVEGDVTREGHAEDDGLVHGLALQAAGDGVPPGEDLLDDHREGQGGDGEIETGHA